MTDTYNNDASHGQEPLAEIEPSKEAHLAAKQTILDLLKSGDKGLRAIAIDELIGNDTFWDSVFNLGAINNFFPTAYVKDGIDIGVQVFASVAGQVHDLSVEVEALT